MKKKKKKKRKNLPTSADVNSCMLDLYPKSSMNLSYTSGVARVPCALGQEIFLRLRQQKPRSLKWKICAKVRKKQKQNIYCSYCLLFWREQ